MWLTVELINAFFPLAPNLRKLQTAKESVDAYQAWEVSEALRVLPDFGEFWEPSGKDVLDVGCGLGGNTVHYAQSGARSVTGVDLRFHSLETTKALAWSQAARHLQVYLADAARLPFAADSFDVIVSVNVFEHVDDLYRTLCECKRVLRADGLIFLYFPPFFSPWGAHLEGWINFPWPHLLFSDRTLLAGAARIEARQRRNAAYIRTAQVDWASLTRLPELNRVTAEQFLHMLEITGLHVKRVAYLPFAHHYLQNKGAVALWLAQQLGRLASLPLLREVITTKMVFVLSKRAPR